MGKIARVTMFKLPKPEDQDACLEAYKKMFAEAKKVRHILGCQLESSYVVISVPNSIPDTDRCESGFG
jgi:hypothetical protein